jgi:antirestriction protein ArdC
MTAATKTRTRRPARKPAAASTEPKFDPYQAVTDRIVELMDAGVNPWRKPWATTNGNGMPVRMSTGKAYRGVNIFLLLMQGMAKGYSSPWWGTYKNIAELGGQVRTGEKSTPVVFWSTFPSKNPDEIDPRTGKPKEVFFLKTFRVFNAEQADGLPARFFPAPVERTEFEAIDAAQTVLDGYLARTGITVTHGGGRATYSPTLDVIKLPEREAFIGGPAEYYSTAFHELSHSTGHADRLNRPELTTFSHFGDDMYSKEELIAELSAAIVAGMTGIGQETEDNSAAYLASWAKVLRGDSRLVVRAATKAHAAAELILGKPDADDTAATAD